jgi:hypothetical protein
MKPPVIRSSLFRQPVLYSRKGRHLLLERSDQNGFALIAVLAVIAITSVTIGALLGMMLTAIKITENQERDARQERAADSAITAAINQLRLQQDPAKDACTPGVPSIADGGLKLEFESSGRTDEATVTCRTAADELGESAGNIELSGIQQSALVTERDWKLFRDSSEVSSDLKDLINPSETNLVHWGNSALKFNGNLSSNGGAVPFRFDPEGTPALDVRGTYDQAAQGIGAAPGSAASCGALSGADAVAATTIRASAGAKCGDPLLFPVSGTPETEIDERIPTFPDLSAGCPAETVIAFDPGKYDQYAVATLNKWFGRGDGSCTDRTFYFKKGRYWFDANTPSPEAGKENDHVLTFDNPTSTFVFGQANGWDPEVAGATAANFPKACDPSLSGASIILSGRTEFRHLAGRLAVCPYLDETDPSATPDPAVAQQATVPTQVTVVGAVSPAGNFSPSPPEQGVVNLLASPGVLKESTATFGCFFINTIFCSSPNTFTVTLSSQMSGRIRSASLNVTGIERLPYLNYVSSRQVGISVTLADGSDCVVADLPGGPPYKSPYEGSPYPDGIATYELLSGECEDEITLGEQLDDAQVTVTYRYILKTASGKNENYQSLKRSEHKLTISDVQVVPIAWTGSTNESLSSSTWVGNKYELQLDDFDIGQLIENAPAEDSQLNSLGVVIKTGAGCSNCSTNFVKLKTVLTLILSDQDQTVCKGTFENVSNQPGGHLYPLLDDCGSGTQVASSLRGSKLKIELTLTCGYFVACPGQVPTQPIQYVGLVATSDSYSKPVKSQLTIDSAAAIPAAVPAGSTGGPASANFFGSAYLKNVDLDLNWNGKASGASLFGGELQLNSLGSLMAPTATADVVCCTAPETNIRKVRLTALVGGEAKLSAVVALNSKEKTAPVVLEWTVCGRNGNCSP